MRTSYILLTLLVISVLATSSQIIYAQNTKAEKITWTAVPTTNATEELGKSIDIYASDLRYDEIVSLPSNATEYLVPSEITDLLLNPSAVMILEREGYVTKDEAAEELGIPAIAVQRVEYDSSNNVTKVYTCISVESVPNTYVVLNQSSYDINPFCFRKIRFAMNYIVNRDYIAREIYHGYAVPQYIVYSLYDPSITDVIDVATKYIFKYSPNTTYKLIADVMNEVGAKLVNGTWYFRGKEVKVNFIIRVEDERKEIGDLVANELENTGIKVNKTYMTFGEAISTVYFTNSMNFKWHIYTEGWRKGGITRWDPWNPYFFYVEWANMFNYRNDTLGELTKDLISGNYVSEEDYVSKLRKVIDLGTQESVRIFIATIMNIQLATNKVEGITLNLGTGLRDTIINARNWYVEGSNEVRVGMYHVWTSWGAWNPFGGLSDIYSSTISRATWDPFIWYNPFNGEPMPFRVTYDVITAGPNGTLDVPPDAVIWNATTDSWVEVGSGVKAVSKVILGLSRLLGTKWHDNSTITWADVLGYYALLYELAYDKDKSSLEPSVSFTVRSVLDNIVAIRPILNESALEIYTNYWHFDKAYIANEVAVSIYNPIEIDLALFWLAFQNRTYALSDERAHNEGIPQIDMVLQDHANDIKLALENMGDNFSNYSKYFTVYGKVLMNESEWVSRINASINWINTYGNAWISDGPFMLTYFDKDEQKCVLTAFKDTAYPIKSEEFYYGVIDVLNALRIVDVEGTTIVRGEEAVINVTTVGPEAVLGYAIVDPDTGTPIIYGRARELGSNSYQIVLSSSETSKLSKSRYTLALLASGKDVAVGNYSIKELVVVPKQLTNTTTLTVTKPLVVGGYLEIINSEEGSGLDTIYLTLAGLAVVATATVALVITRNIRRN